VSICTAQNKELPGWKTSESLSIWKTLQQSVTRLGEQGIPDDCTEDFKVF